MARNGFQILRVWAVFCVAAIVANARAHSEAEVLVEGLKQPSDVVVGENHVYCSVRGEKRLMRIGRVGGRPNTIAENQAHIGRVALDSEPYSGDSYVYWMNGPRIIKRLQRGGPEVVVTETEFRGGRGPSGLAVFGSQVYWTLYFADAGKVMSVATGGGTQKTLAEGQGGPFILAVDSDYVFWTNHLSAKKQVMRYDFKNGQVDTVARDQQNPTWVAVDDSGVYWTDLRPGQGSVLRARKSGGAQEVVAEGQKGPSVVALDNDFVYWTDLTFNSGRVAAESSIRRRPKAGGEIETVVTETGHIWGLAVRDGEIYWTNYTEGHLSRIYP